MDMIQKSSVSEWFSQITHDPSVSDECIDLLSVHVHNTLIKPHTLLNTKKQ